MPLTVPSLDDRNYQQLLREALARIPVHNPEWTNFNDSDPGMTLVQLFAFLTESLLYRANQIPERNRRKFLTLLGIGLRPAAAAHGFVTVQNERGPLSAQTLAADLDVRAGPVRFRTTYGLQVLPVEARAFYKRKLPPATTAERQAELDNYRLLYADLLEEPGTEPAFYATTPMPAPAPEGALSVVDLANDTVDRCLWIALLARPREDPATVRKVIAGQILTVGVMPGAAAEGVVVPAGRETAADTPSRLVWEVAKPPAGGLLPPAAADPQGRVARYAPLPARPTADVLAAPGLVELTLPGDPGPLTWLNLEPAEEGTGDFPPSLADSDIEDRVITWLRLRLKDNPASGEGTSAGGSAALISWIGINATTVVQRTNVRGEVVGTGTGEPDQCFTLANTPVLPETLTVYVNGEPWSRIDDLLAAGPEVPVSDPRRPLYAADGRGLDAPGGRVKVYTLDPESGRICTGDGSHGMRPRRGEPITATYSFGGGRPGNVAAGAINSSPQLPPGFKVTNPLPTWGGDDADDVATAERTIPRTIAHRDRLVSLQDFRDITARTPGVDLGRAEVLPLYDPIAKLDGVPGVVTVLVIPQYDPLAPDAPQPDRFFLDTVCRYLQPRRLVTTELHVRGPVYRDVWVSAGVAVMPGYAAGPVIQAVKDEIKRFLSPLTGGRAATGWPLGVPVLQRELEAVVSRVDGVQLVQELLLGDPAGVSVTQVSLAGLELPRLAGVEAVGGAAVPLSELRSAPAAGGKKLAPIPTIPSKC
jgi:hypothetical protein